MDGMDKIYVEAAQKKAQISGKASTFVKNNLATIALFLCIVIAVAKELYKIVLVDPFSVEYFLNLFTGLFMTMFCYAVFIPFGRRGEISINTSYSKNLSAWGTRTSEVRNNKKMGAFEKYCQKRVDDEREETRQMIIYNETMIDYDYYCSEYKDLKKRDIKALYKSGKITKSERNAIIKANKVFVKPINPLLILCGVQKSTINDAGRDTNQYGIIWFITRPGVIVVTEVVRSCVSGMFMGLSGMSVIYNMMMSILSIIVASGVGYSVGAKGIQKENELVKNRILFIDGFLETSNTIKISEKEVA